MGRIRQVVCTYIYLVRVVIVDKQSTWVPSMDVDSQQVFNLSMAESRLPLFRLGEREPRENARHAL